MAEIIKVKTGITPELMKSIFEFANLPYSLGNQFKCNRSILRNERYGVKTASSIGPKVWDKIPSEIKKFQVP